VAHPKKKPWTKPQVGQFKSVEELLAFFEEASLAEREKLDALLQQAKGICDDGALAVRSRGKGR
jgi:hypothetical protein